MVGARFDQNDTNTHTTLSALAALAVLAALAALQSRFALTASGDISFDGNVYATQVAGKFMLNNR
jgi:hypothetical protein